MTSLRHHRPMRDDASPEHPDTPAARAPASRLWLPVAVACLIAVGVVSVFVGSRPVPAAEVIGALRGQTGGLDAQAVLLRVPRTLLGVLVGASLAVAGALLQGMARNPLADPTILGLNAGASFAVVLGIVLLHLSKPSQYIWLALTGATLTAAAVWSLASMGRAGATPLKLTLSGAICASVCSSLTSALLLPRIDVISVYRFWQVGSIAGARMPLMGPLLPVMLLALACSLLLARPLDSLELGDDMASELGGDVRMTRLCAWALAVVLCACSTALAGPIGFVGLVVPHVARLLTAPARSGSHHGRILAACVVLGPLLLVSADVIGRIITRPQDIEVGIVTALIGAPCFVVLVRRKSGWAL